MSSSEAPSLRLAAAISASASSHTSTTSASPGFLPRMWSRWRSRVDACARMIGTVGRNTVAISPRRRVRTKRPTAWAKNSGVEVAVA
jgi:hypothetical protein